MPESLRAAQMSQGAEGGAGGPENTQPSGLSVPPRPRPARTAAERRNLRLSQKNARMKQENQSEPDEFRFTAEDQSVMEDNDHDQT